MSKSYPTLTFLQVRTMEIAARELYAALSHRIWCEKCGCSRHVWVRHDGKLQAEPCSCVEEVRMALEKYKYLEVEEPAHGQ